MDDLISREAAIDGIESFRPIKPTRGETSMEVVNRSAWECAINCAESFVRTMPPSAQPEQLDRCPIYGGVCGYPSDQCYDCPRHHDARVKSGMEMPPVQPQSTVGQQSDGSQSTKSTNLIDRQAAIDTAKAELDGGTPYDIPSKIEALPPAQPERKTGRWKPFDLTYGRSIYACTACERATEVQTLFGDPRYKYCPWCGAEMEKGEEDGC